MRCPDGKTHHFVRLNDAQLFCERCGDVRTVGALRSAPMIVPYPSPYPWTVPFSPWWVYPTTTITYSSTNRIALEDPTS